MHMCLDRSRANSAVPSFPTVSESWFTISSFYFVDWFSRELARIRIIFYFCLFKMAGSLKGQKSTKFDPTNHISARHLDPFHLILINLTWVYYLTLKLSFRRNFYLKIQDGCRDFKLNFDKFRLKNDRSALQTNPFDLIWTEFCMDILLDLKNKPAEELLTVCKIKDGGRGCHYGKLQNTP